MTRPKISGKFYPLQHEEFLQLSAQLKDAELRVYLYLVTLEPFGDREIEIDTAIIAERLGMVRRTIQRALRRLEELELLDLEIIRFKVKRQMDRQAIHGSPRRQMDRLGDPRIASTTHGSPRRQMDRHRRLKPRQRKASKTLRLLQTIKTLFRLSQKTRKRDF